MTKINAKTFRAALVKAVEDRGADYVYPEDQLVQTMGGLSCAYSIADANGENAEPACIVGYALWQFDPEYVQNLPAVTNVSHVMEGLGVTSPKLLKAIRAAQQTQDAFGTWGEALEEFDFVYRVKSK